MVTRYALIYDFIHPIIQLWSIRRIRPNMALSGSSNVNTTVSVPALEHTFTASTVGGAVLSVAVCNECIYAGCQDGLVHVWDLSTRSKVRSIVVGGEVSILCLNFGQTCSRFCFLFCVRCRMQTSFHSRFLAMTFTPVFRMDT